MIVYDRQSGRHFPVRGVYDAVPAESGGVTEQLYKVSGPDEPPLFLAADAVDVVADLKVPDGVDGGLLCQALVLAREFDSFSVQSSTIRLATIRTLNKLTGCGLAQAKAAADAAIDLTAKYSGEPWWTRTFGMASVEELRPLLGVGPLGPTPLTRDMLSRYGFTPAAHDSLVSRANTFGNRLRFDCFGSLRYRESGDRVPAPETVEGLLALLAALGIPVGEARPNEERSDS